MDVQTLLTRAKQGDATAKGLLRAGVANRDPEALWAMGMMYESGEGLPRNPEKAAEYFRQSRQIQEARNRAENAPLGVASPDAPSRRASTRRSSSPRASTRRASSPPSASAAAAPSGDSPLGEAQLAGLRQAHKLHCLGNALLKWCGIPGVLAGVAGAAARSPELSGLGAILAALGLVVFGAARWRIWRIVTVPYNLSPEQVARHRNLTAALGSAARFYPYINAAVAVPALRGADKTPLFFFPDRLVALRRDRARCEAPAYADVGVVVQEIEVPRGRRWRHAKLDGTRDHRYKENWWWEVGGYILILLSFPDAPEWGSFDCGKFKDAAPTRALADAFASVGCRVDVTHEVRPVERSEPL